MEKEERIKELEERRNRRTTRAFLTAFEVLFILGIPALLAVFIGRAVSESKVVIYIFLAIAFILSWVIVVARVRAIAREIKSIQEEIRILQDEESK